MNLYFFSTLDVILFTPSIINYYLLINIIILILTSSSIIIYKYYKLKDYYIIILNIFFEVLFNIFLFKSNYLFMFIFKLIQFILSIYLNEIIFSNKKSANLFIPYIIWNYLLTLFTTVLLFLNITI